VSQLLQSLLDDIDDPAREDLLQVIPRVHARIGGLTKDEQLRLRDELTEIRGELSRDDAAWDSHQIIYQFLCHLTAAGVEETAEQRALREEIQRAYPGRNGQWKSEECLTPEQMGENIQRRATELLRNE